MSKRKRKKQRKPTAAQKARQEARRARAAAYRANQEADLAAVKARQDAEEATRQADIAMGKAADEVARKTAEHEAMRRWLEDKRPVLAELGKFLDELQEKLGDVESARACAQGVLTEASVAFSGNPREPGELTELTSARIEDLHDQLAKALAELEEKTREIDELRIFKSDARRDLAKIRQGEGYPPQWLLRSLPELAELKGDRLNALPAAAGPWAQNVYTLGIRVARWAVDIKKREFQEEELKKRRAALADGDDEQEPAEEPAQGPGEGPGEVQEPGEGPGEGQEPCCRVCGCTDRDCSVCIERTGSPCFWVEPDLCSACVSSSQKPTEGPGEVQEPGEGPDDTKRSLRLEDGTIVGEDDRFAELLTWSRAALRRRCKEVGAKQNKTSAEMVRRILVAELDKFEVRR